MTTERNNQRNYRSEYDKAQTGAGKANVVRDWLRDVGVGEAAVSRKNQTPGWREKQDPRR